MISLRTLQSPYIIPGLVPTGFRDLLVSSDMLLDARSFFKMLSTRFSWLIAKFKIPSFFRLFFFFQIFVCRLEGSPFYLNNVLYQQPQ